MKRLDEPAQSIMKPTKHQNFDTLIVLETLSACFLILAQLLIRDLGVLYQIGRFGDCLGGAFSKHVAMVELS